ncbi:hypothetical protein LshimejAT787_1204940 [Lyophyllum shimeji]|uniref:Protein kinase domain-containing protein n=1 Tax=Lyophyllum shimeji TaxID=47721 RepID=A0A9P3USZ6_LYOSH|nr:hypothetical protein LshimejAT787_1204940 [Lyophyllum shimeji]
MTACPAHSAYSTLVLHPIVPLPLLHHRHTNRPPPPLLHLHHRHTNRPPPPSSSSSSPTPDAGRRKTERTSHDAQLPLIGVNSKSTFNNDTYQPSTGRRHLSVTPVSPQASGLMSELILSCHLGINHQLGYDPPSEPFVLQRVTQPGCPTPAATLSYRIDQVTEIYEGDYNTVYRASISLLGQELGGPWARDIVLKTDVNARYPRPSMFTQEALRYEKDLRHMQGTSIPNCYGLFQATIYNKLISVLLLEDCGESINFRDESLSDADKIQIWKLFTELHVSGFAHHDVDGRNIVKNRDGKFVLVDLEHSRPHKCEVRLHILIGDFAPRRLDFGCQELYDLAIELDFWLPRFLTIYGYQVPVSEFKNGEAKNIVGLLPSYMFGTEEDREEALRCAEKMIKKVQDIEAKYASVPDEQRYLCPCNIPKKLHSSSKPQASV